jgi:hypothetical protein
MPVDRLRLADAKTNQQPPVASTQASTGLRSKRAGEDPRPAARRGAPKNANGEIMVTAKIPLGVGGRVLHGSPETTDADVVSGPGVPAAKDGCRGPPLTLQWQPHSATLRPRGIAPQQALKCGPLAKPKTPVSC